MIYHVDVDKKKKTFVMKYIKKNYPRKSFYQ